jgi:tetratricopeptide (TPR) repeat protein
MLRHRQIAEYAVNQFAPRALLREAYVRLLQVLANEIRGKKWRSRTFGLYREVINHLTIFKRFAEEIDEARSIYDALSADFKSDAQFWLQYGSLELEGGNLEHAENYINQAESLDSDNMWIQNAKGHLLLRKGIEAQTKTEALAYRDEGSEILLDNIARTDISDAYCYHIYASQRHKWIHHWLTDDADIAKELDDLRRIMEVAVQNYPRNRQLRELHEGIEREYLSLAVRQ